MPLRSQGCAVVVAALAPLASILADLNAITPGTLFAPIPQQALAATDGAGTLIVAASANRKRVVLFGDESMTGTAYFGPTAAVRSANKIGQLKKLSTWPETYTGAIYGVGNDATQSVGGYELS